MSNKTSAQRARARKTKYHQAHPNAGATFSPRGLFRGLKVPLRFTPGQKYLYPERHKAAHA